jgi:beta-barrel assembly-enhancing protease
MSMPAPRRLGRAVRALLDRARPLGLLVLLSFAAGCVDEEQEQQLGDAIAADINAQVPLVLDPFTVGYVNRIGQHIADQSERPDVPYRFYVVNTAMVNAFALPGGHIYVTRGLIARTRNVAELSAVLAHEIGHVAARHGAQALQRELRTGSVVSMLYEIFLGVEPAILEQRALTIGGRLWFATHSRRAEREADRLALRYMIRSGIDPEGMLTMLEGLIEDELEAPQQTVAWFSTHPATEDRLLRLRRKLQTLGDAPPELAQDIASYPLFLERVTTLPPPPDA